MSVKKKNNYFPPIPYEAVYCVKSEDYIFFRVVEQ